ncbi:MAG: hypothetical protein ACYTHK_17870 [Planctomycetota bacterium]
MEALIVVLILVLVPLAIWWSWYAKKKRRELMRKIADELGGRFYQDDPFGLAGRHEGEFPTLKAGSNRYAYNVVTGRWEDSPFWLFDHHYETYSHDKNGRKTHHHYRTFLLTEHDLDLGALDVRPEHLFDKMKAVFGFDDVDFESAEFSKKWHVGAQDREFAYQVFHPKMIEYFGTLRGFRLFTRGRFALYRVGSGQMDAEEMGKVFRYAKGFHERLPRFVRKDRAL